MRDMTDAALLCALIGDTRFLKPPDVHTNGSHPVMSTVEIGTRRQHAFQGPDGFRVLEILGGDPQDGRPGRMRFRQIRVKR
jgi:hypothetical protein